MALTHNAQQYITEAAAGFQLGFQPLLWPLIRQNIGTKNTFGFCVGKTGYISSSTEIYDSKVITNRL